MKFQKLMLQRWTPWMMAVALLIGRGAMAQENAATEFYRLYEGVTLYVNNPQGVEFTVNLEVRDLNLRSDGPREVLYKVYDPDGQPVVREIIPDDGVVTPNFPDRIGGWDHELQYLANLYAKGTQPSIRWSAWSDPKRLNRIVPTTRASPIKGGKKGIYRIVLAGTSDHYVSLRLSPDLKHAVCGHPNFLHGHGDILKKSYIYVPKNTVGLFFAATEPDLPRTRRFKVTAPDGKVLLDTVATGGYATIIKGDHWGEASIPFEKPGQYDGQLLTLEVADGAGDYLIRLALQQPPTKAGREKGGFGDYVGIGSSALFAPDPETAMALQGGTIIVDDMIFWHPFQVRFHNWLKANKLEATDQEKALHKDLETLFSNFRNLETSDGRGSCSWNNWAYAMGYYGCKIFRQGWLLMPRTDVPQEVKNIIKEGLIMGGDRLSFCVNGECVNGNAFSQINVALWYCHRATGDPLQKERFEVFFDRWQHQGWGPSAGLSKSGDSREHFAHDMHYGSYIMDNWRGNTWLSGEGILNDAKDDPRFQKIMDRYRNLYTYLYCREQSGAPIAANPWSARTAAHPHKEATNWEIEGNKWKGEPGADFTVSVNDGDEWFAAHRKNYYILTFHGVLAPEWMSQCFPGQLGFGGGILAQVTVPGKGPVITSTLIKEYGEGMHPSMWRNFHIHSIVGEMWDGSPLISGITEHHDAKLTGNTVASSGEVRNTHVRVARSYTYNPDSIDCEVSMAESDYARALSIWSHGRLWSEVKFAHEMIPFVANGVNKKPTAVTLKDAAGAEIGPATKDPKEAKTIRIDRGGFGVEVQLENPTKVRLGQNSTVMLQIVEEPADPVPPAGGQPEEAVKPAAAAKPHPKPGGKPAPAAKPRPEAKSKPAPAASVHLKYRLVPFGNP